LFLAESLALPVASSPIKAVMISGYPFSVLIAGT
jgi:hypothetical protein